MHISHHNGYNVHIPHHTLPNESSKGEPEAAGEVSPVRGGQTKLRNVTDMAKIYRNITDMAKICLNVIYLEKCHRYGKNISKCHICGKMSHIWQKYIEMSHIWQKYIEISHIWQKYIKMSQIWQKYIGMSQIWQIYISVFERFALCEKFDMSQLWGQICFTDFGLKCGEHHLARKII